MRPNCHRWSRRLSVAFTGLLFGPFISGCSAPSAMGPAAPVFSTQEISVPVNRCERGRCAELTVQTVSFEGYDAFNAFLDQSLASMAWQSQTAVAPYQGLAALTNYFRRSAPAGEQLSLKISVERHTPALVVLLLSQYRFEGGAHGESANQYINWLLPQDRAVSLESILIPGAMPAYTAALRRAHQNWVASQAKTGSIEDASAFTEQWPFVASDNAALMGDGLRVAYPSYALAPGFFGQPSLLIPYAELGGIIEPAILTQAQSGK